MRRDAFAVAAPGLAPGLAEELRELDVDVREVAPAGVAFAADARALYRANLHSRIASRILLRLAEFPAPHFSTLAKRLKDVEWARWIAPGRVIACRVTCRKSRLYHSGAVAERVHEAIGQVVRHEVGATVDEEDDDGTAQLIVVRLDRDRCTLSIDTSGALLHRRGYRLAVAKAPMRETLAAAILRAAGWTGSRPLVDPCCGSGTLPIEGALIARRIAPGIARAFAFERWPGHDPGMCQALRDEARARELAACPVAIAGSDRDAGAIESAAANATRAGVAGDIVFVQQPLSAARPPGGDAGLIVANPPWGERIGDPGPLRNLYAQLGHLGRGPFAGWDLAVFAPDLMLLGQLGGKAERPLVTTVAGLRVHLEVRRAGD